MSHPRNPLSEEDKIRLVYELNDAIGELESLQVAIGNTVSDSVLGSLRWVRNRLLEDCP